MIVIVFLLALILSTRVPAQQNGWSVVARSAPVYKLGTVQFRDSLLGWCAGGDSIYWCKDGGNTWFTGSQRFGPIDDLSFSDSLHGGAVGFAGPVGVVWNTRDGGHSWTRQRNDYPFNFRGAWAFDSLHAVAIGNTVNAFPDTGKIYATADGGLTWITSVPGDSLSYLTKVRFVDRLHGWITTGTSSAKNAIVATTNGGLTWRVRPTPIGFIDISFIDSLEGWAMDAERDGIYKTTDGGLSWKLLSMIGGTDKLLPRALCFIDNVNGWAFGGMFYHGIISEAIYRTTDGGNNWIQESIGLTADFGNVSDAQILNTHLGWAVCDDGSVLRYQVITNVNRLSDVPTHFFLYQNFPNPFNPTTTIDYTILKRDHVFLSVYDLLGREVATLVNADQPAGPHRTTFDATQLASGVYLYRLRAPGISLVQKMILQK